MKKYRLHYKTSIYVSKNLSDAIIQIYEVKSSAQNDNFFWKAKG